MGDISEYIGGLIKMGEGIRALTVHIKQNRSFEMSHLECFPSRFFAFNNILSQTYRLLSADLERLQIFGKLSSSTTPISLRNLRIVVLNDVSVGCIIKMLNPSSLPSLRILYLDGFGGEESLKLAHPEVVPLLSQLEALFLPSRLVDTAPGFLASAFDRTLFIYHCYGGPLPTSLHKILHLRMQSLRADSGPFNFVGLALLTIRIRQSDQISLRSLYLDISLCPTLTVSPELPVEIVDLVRCCAERQIEVIYEEQARECDLVDSYVSEEFCRRQRDR